MQSKYNVQDPPKTSKIDKLLSCNGLWWYLLNILPYLSYLCLESSSSQAAHIHSCDDLISNYFLSVGRLMVSVSNWLLTLLADSRRSHYLPSPLAALLNHNVKAVGRC